jgi:hypothetical protein
VRATPFSLQNNLHTYIDRTVKLFSRSDAVTGRLQLLWWFRHVTDKLQVKSFTVKCYFINKIIWRINMCTYVHVTCILLKPYYCVRSDVHSIENLCAGLGDSESPVSYKIRFTLLIEGSDIMYLNRTHPLYHKEIMRFKCCVSEINYVSFICLQEEAVNNFNIPQYRSKFSFWYESVKNKY